MLLVVELSQPLAVRLPGRGGDRPRKEKPGLPPFGGDETVPQRRQARVDPHDRGPISRWLRALRAVPGRRVSVADKDFPWAARYTSRSDGAEANILDFTPVSNGVLKISFDVKVSSAESRTLDMTLLPDMHVHAPDSYRWREPWFLVWGRTPHKLSVLLARDIADLDEVWHSYDIVTDLDARTFTIWMDGKPVTEAIAFRYGEGHLPAGTAFGRLRIGVTHENRHVRGNSTVVDGEYADIGKIRISNAQTKTPPGLSRR